MEGTRNRRRAEIDKYQPPPVPVREDRNRKGASRSSIKAQKLAASKTAVSDAANTVKKRKRGGVKFREDSDLERDDPSDDDVLPEEDFDDELGRGGAGAKIGKVRGKGKAQKVEKSSDGSSGKVRRRRSDAGRPRSLRFSLALLHTPGKFNRVRVFCLQ